MKSKYYIKEQVIDLKGVGLVLLGFSCLFLALSNFTLMATMVEKYVLQDFVFLLNAMAWFSIFLYISTSNISMTKQRKIILYKRSKK